MINFILGIIVGVVCVAIFGAAGIFVDRLDELACRIKDLESKTKVNYEPYYRTRNTHHSEEKSSFKEDDDYGND